MSSAPLIRRLCIIGVGLIGGSLARVLRQTGAVETVVGAGRRREPLERALELGVVDHIDTNLPAAVADCDMVVVAVPLGAMAKVFAAIADDLAADAVLTDVGSSKASVVDDVQRVFGHVPPRFVPGHPIAGTERSGVEASFPELFVGRKVILTPLAETESDAHERVRAMWAATGADVVDMGVHHHDEVLAATSHLPHVLAYSLVDTLARLDDRAEIFRYAAGGFRDFTRIASSDPTMWHDICLANRDAVHRMIDQYKSDLDRLATAIEQADGSTIMDIFRRAKQARDNLYRD